MAPACPHCGRRVWGLHACDAPGRWRHEADDFAKRYADLLDDTDGILVSAPQGQRRRCRRDRPLRGLGKE